MNLILTGKLALIFNLAQNTLQASLNSKHCLQDKHGNEFCEDSMNPDSIYSVKPYNGLTLVPRYLTTQNGGISQGVFDVKRSRTGKNKKVLVLVSKKVYKNMIEKDINKAIANYKKQALGDKKKLFFFMPFLIAQAARFAASVVMSYAVDELIKLGRKIKPIDEGMKVVDQGVEKVVKDGVKRVEQGAKAVGQGAKAVEQGVKKIVKQGVKKVEQGVKKG